MSLALARWPLRRSIGVKMLVSVGVFGAATIAFGLPTSPIVSMLALLIVGASDTVSMVIRSSLVQLLTPDHMRGRVNAVYSLFIGTSNQLGEFESGLAAGIFGLVPAVVFGGVATVAIALIWSQAFPHLRKVVAPSG